MVVKLSQSKTAQSHTQIILFKYFIFYQNFSSRSYSSQSILYFPHSTSIFKLFHSFSLSVSIRSQALSGKRSMAKYKVVTNRSCTENFPSCLCFCWTHCNCYHRHRHERKVFVHNKTSDFHIHATKWNHLRKIYRNLMDSASCLITQIKTDEHRKRYVGINVEEVVVAIVCECILIGMQWYKIV